MKQVQDQLKFSQDISFCGEKWFLYTQSVLLLLLWSVKMHDRWVVVHHTTMQATVDAISKYVCKDSSMYINLLEIQANT